MLNIAEYREKSDRLTDFLPWALLIAPGVMLNKDGSFMRTVSYRGPDLDSATRSELITARSQLNNALRRLGSGWCLHMEAQRYATHDYPESDFPEAATAMIDQARRESFQTEGSHYESRYYLTFTFLPPQENIGRARDLMIENNPTAGANYRHELDKFMATTDQITDVLRSTMPSAAPLNDDQLLTYLHSCISTKPQNVTAPDIPMYLDYFIADQDLTGGLIPKLGDDFIATISFRAYPSKTTPSLLDALNQMPMAYRWSTRYIALDKVDAQSELAGMQRKWFAKRKGVIQIAQEAVTNQPSTQEDPEALSRAADVEEARQELGEDLVSMGYVTPTITVTASDPETLRERVRSVQSVIDSNGFISTVEDINAVEAWLGSLPGHAYADVRRAMVNSLNIASIVPVSATWAGPTRNRHLNGPPLMQTRTSSATPFRLSNHVGDVGHTMIVGPTGAGKSVLLGLMAAQFRRYENAQVYFFDKGRSCRSLTASVGGQFFNLGDSDQLAFQPLANVDQMQERQWAHEWLGNLIERQNIELIPQERTELWNALNNLATAPKEERTFTVLRELVQSSNIKDGLHSYTLDGAHGHLFDADHTSLEYADWQAFEMEELMETQSITAPVLTYLFHILERRFDGRPTMLILDEGWVFLDDDYFAAKLREWLKTLRRQNVSVVFATQSPGDVVNSKIADAIIESCPTRIFLPNAAATDNATAYNKFGLNARQVEIIARSIPKRDYYYQSIAGNRLFELNLTEFELTLIGSNSKEELTEIDAIEGQNPDSFLEAFLEHKGFDPSITEGYHANQS